MPWTADSTRLDKNDSCKKYLTEKRPQFAFFGFHTSQICPGLSRRGRGATRREPSTCNFWSANTWMKTRCITRTRMPKPWYDTAGMTHLWEHSCKTLSWEQFFKTRCSCGNTLVGHCCGTFLWEHFCKTCGVLWGSNLGTLVRHFGGILVWTLLS